MTINGRTNKYYIGDIGTLIRVDTGVDIHDATTVSLLVLKPSDVIEEWDGEVDEDFPTEIQHTTELGDFTSAGTYKVQAYVETTEGTWKGSTTSFVVSADFA